MNGTARAKAVRQESLVRGSQGGRGNKRAERRVRPERAERYRLQGELCF